MDTQVESTQIDIDDADEKLMLSGNQEAVQATSETANLRKERVELSKEKERLVKEN